MTHYPSPPSGSIGSMANHRCWHCDVVAHMTRSGPTLEVKNYPSPNGTVTEVQQAFTCDECGWLQIAHSVRPARRSGGWDTAKTQYWIENDAQISWVPAVGVAKYFEDVPTEIAEAASEAHRCYSIQAHRGAAALARAVVEASAKAKGIKDNGIATKINKLHEKGHIREHIREAAHEVRYLGNEVAHGDFVDPVEQEEAEECLALMAEVLQEVFQSPARVARAKAAREAKKAARKAAEAE